MRIVTAFLALALFASFARAQLTTDEQKAVANAVRRLQQEANERSSAEWKKIATREQWDTFAKSKLAALRDSLGSFPTPKVPDIRVTGTIVGDGFTLDNIVYESRPGFWVTANLYRPAKPRESMPGIAIVHAHHTPKEHGELQDMGMTWARAGCLVLVMDQLGHGERRQHPFVDASSFSKPYRVSRQDYAFRYDNAIRLHLVGESLIGWMAWDIQRGIDVLLKKGCDPKRVILLGSVAGGGDPCAVAAALDERITCAVPFNFGGPQPEAKFPLPDDAETSFNYLGGGSWESTRNLRLSGRDGFLPWVIVGSLAKRKLVYGHEFNWDQERDPVWKRFQKIDEWFGGKHLAFTTGRGSVRGSTPQDTHCTHIGAVQRASIHEAFRTWFQIDVTPEKEFRDRLPAEKLRCLTPEIARELQPKTLGEMLAPMARRSSEGKTIAEKRELWKSVLGNVEGKRIGEPTSIEKGVNFESFILKVDRDIPVPVTILYPPLAAKPPVVVVLAQAGTAKLRKDREKEFAELLAKGFAVVLPDVRGTGETSMGNSRGRQSAATSYSSSLLMHGDPLLAGQLRDVRAVLGWVRAYEKLDRSRLILWGESLAKTNAANANFDIPRDDDDAMPAQCEPLGGFLALLAALYEDDVRAVYLRGLPTSFRAVLKHHLVSIPHDVVLPGMLKVGDLDDLMPRLFAVGSSVDERNRLVNTSEESPAAAIANLLAKAR